jgi:hypothetical protein
MSDFPVLERAASSASSATALAIAATTASTDVFCSGKSVLHSQEVTRSRLLHLRDFLGRPTLLCQGTASGPASSEGAEARLD